MHGSDNVVSNHMQSTSQQTPPNEKSTLLEGYKLFHVHSRLTKSTFDKGLNQHNKGRRICIVLKRLTSHLTRSFSITFTSFWA